MGQEDASAGYPIFISDDGQVMDLTGSQLPDLSSVPLPPTLTELDLTANRLSCIDPQFRQLAQLQKLSLRQNLITDTAASELCQLPPLTSLAELVLRDNQLMQIPPVSPLCNLRILDLSYNEIKSLAGLSSVHSGLTELYVTNNQLTKIEELLHLSELNLLELGSNKIRVMEGLEGLTKLSELWLGRNKIREVALCGLTSLTKISIQSNRLTSMLGLQACRLLQELYLSHNGINVMEGLESLTNLRILDLAANRITAIQNLETLTRLEDLWLNDNSIPSLEGIEAALAGPRQSLTTLYLERNPCEHIFLMASGWFKRSRPEVARLVSLSLQMDLDALHVGFRSDEKPLSWMSTPVITIAKLVFFRPRVKRLGRNHVVDVRQGLFMSKK